MTAKPSAPKRRKPPAITLLVEESLWRRRKPALVLLRRAARLALAEHRTGRSPVQLTILLGDDARLKALNRQFRGKNKPTNVLSFPGEGPYLGDIALAYGTIAREARAQGKSFAAHAAHLAAHGVLHLIGFDHETPEEAEAMESLETALVARLGISDPYAPRRKAA